MKGRALRRIEVRLPAAKPGDSAPEFFVRLVWRRIFKKIAAASLVPGELFLDRRHVKAHRSARSSKKGEFGEAIGRSHSGRNGGVKKPSIGNSAAFPGHICAASAV